MASQSHRDRPAALGSLCQPGRRLHEIGQGNRSSAVLRKVRGDGAQFPQHRVCPQENRRVEGEVTGIVRFTWTLSGKGKSMASEQHTNKLIDETSPYLLQHAHNPVDWYPWGPEALERSRTEDKPILLSIGYSACHWCHVMEHESFENSEIAQLMNDNFVCIKVDREERPDLDSIYMNAVQMMTGHGGWPMTMFLTPDLKPFYGGTYYPPVPRHGMPSFPHVLMSVAEAYRSQQEQVVHTATTMLGELRRVDIAEPSREILTTELLDSAYRRIAANY